MVSAVSEKPLINGKDVGAPTARGQQLMCVTQGLSRESPILTEHNIKIQGHDCLWEKGQGPSNVRGKAFSESTPPREASTHTGIPSPGPVNGVPETPEARCPGPAVPLGTTPTWHGQRHHHPEHTAHPLPWAACEVDEYTLTSCPRHWAGLPQVLAIGSRTLALRGHVVLRFLLARARTTSAMTAV